MPSPVQDAEFLTRNAVAALPEGALAQRLGACAREGRQLRAKLGLDPTAPDIHLGHSVVLQKLREFQDLGHKVVLIVGDYTARVGDPSGRSATRPALSGADIDAAAESYQRQAFKVLRDDPEVLEVRRNGEWLDMSMEDLFRLARTTTVAQLLERNDFATRFAEQRPISVLELLYPLMQGYDSVAIRSDVELGGTDQTFNLMLGRDIQRAYGQPEQSVLTMPILPGIDGVEKMSKSLGNHIGLTEPPSEMYGKTLRIPDEAMDEWFRLLGIDEPEGEIGPRDRKRALARAIVTRFHDADAAAAAEAGFDKLFIAREVPDEMLAHVMAPGEDGRVHLPAELATAFGISRGEARRMLSQGAVKADGNALSAEDLDVEPARLDGVAVQLGKRRFARFCLSQNT